jgi:hypothetical protein
MSNPQLDSEEPIEEVEGPPEEDDSSDSEDYSIPGDDQYSAGDPAHVILKGHAESYDQYFLVVFYFVLEDEFVQLENVTAISSEENDIFKKIDDGKEPTELNLRINEVIDTLPENKVKDSHNFRNKLERNLKQNDTIEELYEPLDLGDVEEFRSLFTDILRDQIFPGSKLDVGLKVVSPEQGAQDVSEVAEQAVEELEEEPEEAPPEEDESPETLMVSPEYDPVDGVRLEYLTRGSSFYVRVTGPSVSRLKETFVDGDDPEEAKQSKPLSAELLEVTEAPMKESDRFTVQLGSNLLGKFSANPSTKVQIKNLEELPWHVRFRRQLYYAVALLLIFLFSTSVTFFLFPEAIIQFFSL